MPQDVRPGQVWRYVGRLTGRLAGRTGSLVLVLAVDPQAGCAVVQPVGQRAGRRWVPLWRFDPRHQYGYELVEDAARAA